MCVERRITQIILSRTANSISSVSVFATNDDDEKSDRLSFQCFGRQRGISLFESAARRKQREKKVEIPKERIGGRIGTFPRVIFHWMASRNVYS